MIDLSQAEATAIVIHKVGNKSSDEGFKLSKSLFETDDDELRSLLLKYLLSPFKYNEYYKFQHSVDIKLNPVYSLSARLFEDASQFYEVSKGIVAHLYDQSGHPKIKSGEVYMLLLRGCHIDGSVTDAIGIFKSENKETFLKVNEGDSDYQLLRESGINLNRLDKGCLIFDLNPEEGYKVCIVDNLNSGGEAQYWREDFLMLAPYQDDHYNTKNYMGLCKSFVTDKLAEDFDVNKADQALMLSRSLNYFKKNDKFDIDEFSQEVIGQENVINAFKAYKNEYEADKEIQIADSFDISDTAVKKQSRVFKSVLKLDKNFHIYIHGDRSYIEKGYDEQSGLNFYKVYFKEEQ